MSRYAGIDKSRTCWYTPLLCCRSSSYPPGRGGHRRLQCAAIDR